MIREPSHPGLRPSSHLGLLPQRLQVALGWLRQKAPAELIGRIYSRELRYGEACPARAAETSDRIGLDSQLGVFVIFGAFFVAAAAAAGVETYLVNRNERNERKAAATHGEQGTKTDDDGGNGDPAALTDGDMLREIYREIRRTRVARIEGQAALRAEELALAAAAEMVVSDASYSSNAPARDRTIVL